MSSFITFLTKIPYALLLLLAVASVVTGDYFAVLWSEHRTPALFVLTVVLYAGSGLFFTPTLAKHGLIYGSLLWTILATLGFLCIGVFVFKEKLTVAQSTGVVLGVCSLILLSLQEK